VSCITLNPNSNEGVHVCDGGFRVRYPERGECSVTASLITAPPLDAAPV